MAKIPEQRNPRSKGAQRADKSFNKALAKEAGRGGGGGGGGGGSDWKGGGGCLGITLLAGSAATAGVTAIGYWFG